MAKCVDIERDESFGPPQELEEAQNKTDLLDDLL